MVQMNRRVELAFGSGQFVCVGRGIAMVEVGKVIGEVSCFFFTPYFIESSCWVCC